MNEVAIVPLRAPASSSSWPATWERKENSGGNISPTKRMMHTATVWNDPTRDGRPVMTVVGGVYVDIMDVKAVLKTVFHLDLERGDWWMGNNLRSIGRTGHSAHAWVDPSDSITRITVYGGCSLYVDFNMYDGVTTFCSRADGIGSDLSDVDDTFSTLNTQTGAWGALVRPEVRPPGRRKVICFFH